MINLIFGILLIVCALTATFCFIKIHRILNPKLKVTDEYLKNEIAISKIIKAINNKV